MATIALFLSFFLTTVIASTLSSEPKAGVFGKLIILLVGKRRGAGQYYGTVDSIKILVYS